MRKLCLLLIFIPPALGGIKLIPHPRGIYHSAFPNFGGPEDRVSCARIRNFEELAGKKIVWAAFSNNWLQGIKFPGKHVEEISRCGRLPYIRLMARSSFNFGPDPVYTLQRIIDGDFDPQLRQWAKEARRYGGPLLVEFGVEMNGNWFPWSGYWNGAGRTDGYGDPGLADGPERFRDAYRHIIQVFREEGAVNITWFFHANAESFPHEAWNRLGNYYPGDDYVDWVGLSVYGPIFPEEREEWNSLSFRDRFLRAYRELRRVAPKKPLAVLEFGVTEDPRKPSWIGEAFAFIKSFPEIKAISWWQERWENEDGSFSDLRINSSRASLEEYKRQIKSPLFKTTPVFNLPFFLRPR